MSSISTLRRCLHGALPDGQFPHRPQNCLGHWDRRYCLTGTDKTDTGDQIKKAQMSKACSTCEAEWRCIQSFTGEI